MYARYRTRSRFYKRPEKALRAYNVGPNLLRKPQIKRGLLNGIYTDETIDLRDRERLELVESIRHPKERDFYQDHTYHNQWIARDLDQHQKVQLASRYRYFDPGFEVSPWIWYPGDIVEIVDGEGVGQRGSIIAVVKYKNEILVQNVNVQDVTIPATETRPEQLVQREHPISVHRVRHVDPSTNELCHLELVKVRNKETGALEEKRISLESGVLIPIPQPEDSVEAGDPLKDTPIQDADEATYDAEREMPVLVERRLRAMEDYFIKSLKSSYEFHESLRRRNAEDMLHFQAAVVRRASQAVAAGVVAGGEEVPANAAAELVDEVLSAGGAGAGEMPKWWEEMIEPYVVELQEEAQAAAEEAAREAAEEGHGRGRITGMTEEDRALEEDEEEDDA